MSYRWGAVFLDRIGVFHHLQRDTDSALRSGIQRRKALTCVR